MKLHEELAVSIRVVNNINCYSTFGDKSKVDFTCSKQKYVWSNGTHCNERDVDFLIAPPHNGTVISNSFYHASKMSAMDGMGDIFRFFSYDIETKKLLVDKDREFAQSRNIEIGDASKTDLDFSKAFTTDRLILNNAPYALKEFAGKTYFELTAFYTSGAIGEVVPPEYLEHYKYTSGTIVHGARLWQTKDIADASGQMAGYATGFLAYEYIFKPVLGEPVPANVNTTSVLGSIKAAHIFNSIDSFVVGVNGLAANFMPANQVFAGAMLKKTVDPLLFNLIYDYSGMADEDAMAANSALTSVGVGLQILAAVNKANSPYSAWEHAQIIAKQNAIMMVTNTLAVLTAEFVIKPSAKFTIDNIIVPTAKYVSEITWEGTLEALGLEPYDLVGESSGGLEGELEL